MTDVCLGESKGDIAAHIQNGDWCDLGTALNTTASDHWLQWGLRNSDRFRAEKLFCVDSGSEMVAPVLLFKSEAGQSMLRIDDGFRPSPA